MSSRSTFLCPQSGGSSPGEPHVAVVFDRCSSWPRKHLQSRSTRAFDCSGAELVCAVNRATEVPWEQLNERRLSLIDKDIDQGLSAAEQVELAELEKKAEEHFDKIAPLSFEIIDRLKECAARDGLTVELD